MKRVIIGLIVMVFTITVFYAAIAFIFWELNPEKWSEGTRAFMGIFGVFCSIIAALWVQKLIEEK
jgi:hypothetical protein